MTKIVFACISPHPPIILPSMGSEKDRNQVKNTINALQGLGKELKDLKPDSIIISSPHSDWGFNVPLFFLAGRSLDEGELTKGFKDDIKTYLTGQEEPKFYFEKGKKTYQELDKNKKYALIASGDLSHCLKEEGPYCFHPDGPKFDKSLIEHLKKKDVENLLKLNDYFPQAGECGLRSFCFILGILEAFRSASSGQTDWQSEVLSYEGPFGVGYLVVNFKIQ